MTELLLLESPRLNDIFSPITSTTLSSQAYVLSLASLPAHYASSASSPSNTIDIFDKSTLQGVQTLSGHDVATTSLKTVDLIAGLNHKSLVSSGKDGSVKVWDERSISHGIKSEHGNPLDTL
jgi:WD40 repeat protein